MGLKDVGLRPQYDSLLDNVYDDFFNPILKESRQYSRIGGSFTSKHFAACAEGLQEFIQNDGIMKLVLLPKFSEDDLKSINKGLNSAHDVLSERWISDLSEIREKFVDDHVRALAWMLANGNLEIKLVVPVGNDGAIVPGGLRDSQVFSQKAGVMWDGDGLAVSFSGNIDFDDPTMGEYYRFRAYRSWSEDEKKYVDKDWEHFQNYWEGGRLDISIGLKTISLPKAVRESLIRIAPKSKSDISLKNQPRLRPYQKEAVQKWMGSGGNGILEMATGTGKTFTALGCVDEIRKSQDKLLIVVSCPSDNLERQWKAEMSKWGLDSVVTSRNPKWAQRVSDGIASLRVSNVKSTFAVITTYKTLKDGKLVEAVRTSRLPVMLIADEVHNAGSPKHSKGLDLSYKYRLGLSATFERYFDPEGTKALRKYFGDVVYTMDLATAIRNGFLSEYDYYVIRADLSGDEYKQYCNLTKKIAMLYDSDEPPDREELESALFKRSWVIRDAANKINKFQEWVDGHEDIQYALVYCSENQIKIVKQILNKNAIITREVTANNPPDPRKRKEILDNFSLGHYDVIVANKVLDEGADIPAAKSCFILASTGNPKQFIQRRGRVLRKFNGRYKDGSVKEFAAIYDVVIIPKLSPNYSKDEIRVEQRIVSSQIRRMEEMARSARNIDLCMDQIKTIRNEFNLDY